MIFSLAIYSTPSSQSSRSAYRFAESLITEGHTLFRVFFYHDAAYQGSQLHCYPQDETNLTQRWQLLAKTHNIDLVICIAAGLKRGVLDTQEAERYEQPHSNLSTEFNLSGLGQLVDATVQSDRVITFGG
ncbi:sulfurtransferase complex subunit TusD [Eionea flava]